MTEQHVAYFMQHDVSPVQVRRVRVVVNVVGVPCSDPRAGEAVPGGERPDIDAPTAKPRDIGEEGNQLERLRDVQAVQDLSAARAKVSGAGRRGGASRLRDYYECGQAEQHDDAVEPSRRLAGLALIAERQALSPLHGGLEHAGITFYDGYV